MEAKFYVEGKAVKHPLESKLNANGWDILSAIERQRMAVMNVKGQLAEYYLNVLLENLLKKLMIQEFEWRTESPDFSVVFDNKPFRMECKNIRINEKRKDGKPSWWVEVQRTRDSKKGKSTRAYKVSDFDVLAVCLFNKMNEWSFRFAAANRLAVRTDDNTLLQITQFVAEPATPPWYDNLVDALKDAQS